MIANGSDPVLKDTAVFNLGLLYALTGKGEKSEAAFNTIINDYADSIYYPLAKEKIAG